MGFFIRGAFGWRGFCQRTVWNCKSLGLGRGIALDSYIQGQCCCCCWIVCTFELMAMSDWQ